MKELINELDTQVAACMDNLPYHSRMQTLGYKNYLEKNLIDAMWDRLFSNLQLVQSLVIEEQLQHDLNYT